MSIHREDLDRGRIDFGDVASGERFPPIAPGEILRSEFLEPMEISVYALAKAIKVTRSRINDIVLGRRAISADTALRLARYFGTTPEFWVNLQSAYDLATAKATLAERVRAEVTPRRQRLSNIVKGLGGARENGFMHHKAGEGVDGQGSTGAEHFTVINSGVALVTRKTHPSLRARGSGRGDPGTPMRRRVRLSGWLRRCRSLAMTPL